MKTSRDFVARIVATEFTSGMKHGHDCLESRNLCLLVNIHRNTSTVVDYTNLLVTFFAGQKSNLDIVGKATHGLVAGVVEDLGNEMMKAIRTSGTNVHSRALSHRFKTLQYLDGIGSV